MAKHTPKGISSEFISIQVEALRRKGLAEPLHVVLDEDLNDLTANTLSPLQSLVGSAASGHVGTKKHISLSPTHVHNRGFLVVHAKLCSCYGIFILVSSF